MYNVDMKSPTKPLSNENINRVEKALYLKHEVMEASQCVFQAA